MENKVQFHTKNLSFVKLTKYEAFFEIMLRTLNIYDVKFIAVPSLKLKDLLNTIIDPVQAVNRSGVYIIHLNIDSRNFLYIGMTLKRI